MQNNESCLGLYLCVLHMCWSSILTCHLENLILSLLQQERAPGIYYIDQSENVKEPKCLSSRYLEVKMHDWLNVSALQLKTVPVVLAKSIKRAQSSKF